MIERTWAVTHESLNIWKLLIHINLGYDVTFYMKVADTKSIYVFHITPMTNKIKHIFSCILSRMLVLNFIIIAVRLSNFLKEA